MLHSFFILVAHLYVKKDLFHFILALNGVCEKHAFNFWVIGSDPKSVLLNDPDIVLLRKNHHKWG